MIQIVDTSDERILTAYFGWFHVKGHEPRARRFLYEAVHGHIAPRRVILTVAR